MSYMAYVSEAAGIVTAEEALEALRIDYRQHDLDDVVRNLEELFRYGKDSEITLKELADLGIGELETGEEIGEEKTERTE